MTLRVQNIDLTGTGSQLALAANDDLLLTQGTTIVSTDGTAIIGISDNVIFIDGAVYGQQFGIFTQGDNNRIVIGQTGSVAVFNPFGSIKLNTIASGNNGEIINHGTISGGTALFGSLGLNARLENTGTATGTEAFVFEAMDTGSQNLVVNSGYAYGTSFGVNVVDNLGSQTTDIFNSGMLGSDGVAISGSADIENVFNNGLLIGDVRLGGGNDLFDGRGGTVQNGSVFGGAGDDVFVINVSTIELSENANGGTDTVRTSVNWKLGDNFETLKLTGHSDINGTGNDADNAITGNSGANLLRGDVGNDKINAGSGDDALRGNSGDDTLNGSSGDDTLRGGLGADKMNGGNGDDLLVGGLGKDVLTGGADDDTFRFTKTSHSPTSSQQDRITDFSQGEDMIDLSRLSQDPLTYIGTGVFSATGQAEVRVKQAVGDGLVRVDIDGDGTTDMTIKIVGFFDFAESDFLL